MFEIHRDPVERGETMMKSRTTNVYVRNDRLEDHERVPLDPHSESWRQIWALEGAYRCCVCASSVDSTTYWSDSDCDGAIHSYHWHNRRCDNLDCHLGEISHGGVVPSGKAGRVTWIILLIGGCVHTDCTRVIAR